jgi:hypothetical protein
MLKNKNIDVVTIIKRLAKKKLKPDLIRRRLRTLLDRSILPSLKVYDV